MTPIFLNALNVTRAVITIPRVGVWFADLDVDLDVTGIVPTGKAVLKVGTAALTCTIDDRSSGMMGKKASIQVVGGGGGWDKPVSALHIHNDFGVTTTNVFSVTAAEVGEAVVDALPTVLGPDFVRTEGPASRVLAGREWFVDTTGITIIGPRPPLPMMSPFGVLDWDPNERVATLAGDDLIMPGTVLVDTRFGTATVRDVEQTFGPGGARAIAWCDTDSTDDEESGNRLARGLALIAVEAAGLAYLRHYRYRVVAVGPDKRLTLQLVNADAGAPELLTLVEAWMGVAGSGAIPTPGSEVLVVFADGDPSQPKCVAFAPLGAAALDPFAKAIETAAALTTIETQIAALAAAIAVFANPATNALIVAASLDGGAALLASATSVVAEGPSVLASIAALPSTQNFTT